MVALSVARFTTASETPGTFLRARSTRPTHDAQVMPSIANSEYLPTHRSRLSRPPVYVPRDQPAPPAGGRPARWQDCPRPYPPLQPLQAPLPPPPPPSTRTSSLSGSKLL